MKNRITSLDTAKGIAILAVILGHYFQEFSPDKMNIVEILRSDPNVVSLSPEC